ncbi:DUF4097 family beta strand repeat-containing protein [Aureisphaera galaxeae]|uniref:DUF4097 family beta strand repeat-containing protein n=1 Tax=Aureisphaera galaxeae TaxID=1538023 RepID=UPI0023509245|nr:DUF4097 family beta strand repeat-containing protein [Aureisphaera galaxeae]MDC8002979.1 DUF4097 family beta strand repeat-containing protein [Aureisphaera galaxeae]
MKRISICIIALLLSCVAWGQKEYKTSLSGVNRVVLETNTTVDVEIGSSGELILRDGKKRDSGYSDGNEKEDERAKGLTALYAGGVDNTGFGMATERDGSTLRLKDLKPFTQRSRFTLILPKNIDLTLDCGNLGSANIANFTAELEIETNVGHIKLMDVTGPITANTSTGAIDVTFTSVNQSAPISISSSTGTIDVSLPTNTKADVEMRTSMGTVYSNFDLVPEREDGLKIVGANRKIKGQLNGGGVDIRLISSVGNIYLRKK